MGIEAAEEGTDGRAPAKRWGWHLSAIDTHAGAAQLHLGGQARRRAGAGGRPPLWATALWATIRSRASWFQVLTAGAAAVVAIEFLAPVGGHDPALRAIAESLIALLALLAAGMLVAQFAHTRRRWDLTLLAPVLLFALLQLVCGVLPAALAIHSSGQLAATAYAGRLFVAGGIVAAAFTPSNQLVARFGRPVAMVVALALVALASAVVGGLLVRSGLAAVASPMRLGDAINEPLALAVALVTSGLLACAAARFAQRAHAERDGAMALLAGAGVLMAIAALSSQSLRSASYGWISPLQGLWLAAVALIVAAVARQEIAVRAQMLRAAALAERRRVARDLHDGLAQDLAFIVSHGPQLAAELGVEHPLTIAASRALTVTRGTITDLSDAHSTTPRDALEAIAHELRDRFQMAIAISADDAAELPSDSRDHVLRIAREAIANAGRHGGAKNVLVSLSQTSGGLALRVRDDGCGIRRGGSSILAEGFGIGSMRERAAALGGQLTVREDGGGGTELEVVVP